MTRLCFPNPVFPDPTLTRNMQSSRISFVPTFPFPCSSPKSLPFRPKTRSLPQSCLLCAFNPRPMSSFPGISVRCGVSGYSGDGFLTLAEFLGKGGVGVVGDNDLVVVFQHLQYACKRIAAVVGSPFNSGLGQKRDIVGKRIGVERAAPKPLDIVSASVFLISPLCVF